MSESLRDQLSANLDKLENLQPGPATPIDGVDDKTIAESEAVGKVNNEKAIAEDLAQADRPGRTAGRERDERGRLLPGAAKKPDAPEATVAAPNPIPEFKRPPRPSSWKKDYWPAWDTLDPKLAEYINQRESEYAKGVSTYKGEWENAKPLLDVVQSYNDTIQLTGRSPAEWINELGTAHRILTQGSPEQKLSILAQIALNNGIDLRRFAERVYLRGEDGQLYINPNLRAAPQQPQVQQQPQDINKHVRAVLAEERANQEIARMKADTEKYPHFDAVRESMLGLLQGGLAQDLEAAYQASLRLPKHSDIWDAIQEQKRAAEEAERKAAEAKRLAAAKAAAVSPRGATPTSGASAGGKKGLRSTIEEAFEASVGGGRV